MEVSTVPELVAAAVGGDKNAWDALVTRFAPLVYSVIRSYRLPSSDAQDVAQTVWLRLLEHLADVREPRALPGWISVTTRNAVLGVFNSRKRVFPVDPFSEVPREEPADSAAVDADLLRSERRQVLRDALEELAPHQRQLVLLLLIDPPISYQEISERLKIPVGSIGATRARAFNRLRSTPPMKAYFGPDNRI